ncbi:MAG: response regulator transcription factor [Deltaproteobacteria bacterium]|jgi:two-component system response regulator CpxR|nr:response regulator transcription factor [Deltaproteobacteria bacterium]
MSRILVIDDDTELCELLADYLKPEGFQITSVHDGEQGLQRAISEAGGYDLIVLDIMLPGMNGFEVLQRLRSQLDTPVLMLTARDEEVDRIVGLEMGADDYLPKPFNPRELIARARAILRRTRDRHDRSAFPATPEMIAVGDIEMDTGSRIVRRNGEKVDLTSVEFGCLEMLLRAAGHLVTREQLAEGVLGRSLTAYDRSVDVHLSSLRKKLGHRFGEFERIKTVRGAGYVYANPFRTDKDSALK